MAEPKITKESIIERAREMGVKMTDQRLQVLYEQMLVITAAAKELDSLDLDGVGQANVFSPVQD
jgi:hypothetical protein